MQVTVKQKWFLIISPIIVLAITKIAVELSICFFRADISWIPAFAGYYLSILFVFFLAKKYFSIPVKDIFKISLKPFPKFGLMFFCVILPALIPLNVLITKIHYVPLQFYFYILIFSCINPLFEEGFWRGLLSLIPGNKWFKIIYSALLFGFSHYLFWAFWFRSPIAIYTTVFSTTIMGLFWMYFMDKKKNLAYPIISHFFVDVFNLSVAVYCGLVPLDAF